ncbi:hypothetical protein ACIG87_26060 [Micromonospora sp. NPDC051925]|uniref:hypothetical protein n=1 Tax=Micromonospora sp. NPDC051925 TaxID=3364288 RepID=UPI0037C5C247
MPPSDHPTVPGPAGRMSRRRILALSALAAAAPFGVVPRPAPAVGGDTDAGAYQKAFEAALAADQNVRRYTAASREILYRPRQLLAADVDVQRVATWLRTHDYPVSLSA